MTIKDQLAAYGGFVDVGILWHGFAPYMRDYDVVFEALWGERQWADAKGTYRLRFTHCPEATIVTAVADAAWKEAWADDFVDKARWEKAGEPRGFCWWACWSNADPGVAYVDDSPRAKEWSERLGERMHEVTVTTEAFQLRIVFHDFTVTKLNDQVQVVDKTMFPLEPETDPEQG